MSEFTDATNFEVEEGHYKTAVDADKQEKTGDVEVNRWEKKGDRLYINGPAKWEKNGTYLDLETGELCDLPGSRDVSVDVSGDEVTITVVDEGGLGYDDVWTVVLSFETPDEDDEENDESQELVADGGEDASDIVTDEEIEAAIESKDDPEHPDAYTVEEVRDVLAAINAAILDFWDEHQDAIDDSAHEIVHEDRNVIVLADSGHFWTEQFRAMDIGDEDGILQSIIKTLQHTAARKNSDYSWSVSDPVVVRKTAAFGAGEQQVLREVARRTEEFGSVARAVDTLATDVHGWSKSNWADLTDRNRSTVTRTTDN